MNVISSAVDSMQLLTTFLAMIANRVFHDLPLFVVQQTDILGHPGSCFEFTDRIGSGS